MNIYYWSKLGKITDPQYLKAISELANGTYAPKRLKRMKGHNLFRYKATYQMRILFLVTKVNGEDALYVVSVNKHKYNTDSILRDGVLDKLLQRQADALEHSSEKSKFILYDREKENLLPAITSATENIKLIPAYIGSALYVLDDPQQQALQIAAPGVIIGDPGTGKTLVGYTIIEEALRGMKEEQECQGESFTPLPIAYIVKSAHLRDVHKKYWLLTHATEGGVQFLTIEEVLKLAGYPLDKSNIADKDCFTSWFTKAYLCHEKNTAKVSGSQWENLLQPEEVYQELILLSGYVVYDKASDEEIDRYLSLGRSQSLIATVKDRGVYISIYDRYLQYLEAEKKIDLNLLNGASKTETRFRLIICDEAQDLSPKTHTVLKAMVNKENIIYLWGTHQNVTSHIPTLDYVTQNLAPNKVILPFIHRCPASVFSLIEYYIDLKRQLVGGEISKLIGKPQLSAAQKNNPGQVNFISTNQELHNALASYVNRTDFCIVTHAQFLEEALNLTPLAFDIREFKGAQSAIVMAYRLFDSKEYVEANKKLNNGDKARQRRTRTPDTTHAEVLDTAIAIISRTTDRLYIYQPNYQPRNLGHFVEPVLKLNKQQLDVQPIVHEQLTSATREDWQHKQQELREKGFDKQADAIGARYFDDKSAAAIEPAQPNRDRKKHNQGAQALYLAKNKEEKATTKKPQTKPLPSKPKTLQYQAISGTPHDALINSFLSKKTEKQMRKALKTIVNHKDVGAILLEGIVTKFESEVKKQEASFLIYLFGNYGRVQLFNAVMQGHQDKIKSILHYALKPSSEQCSPLFKKTRELIPTMIAFAFTIFIEGFCLLLESDKELLNHFDMATLFKSTNKDEFMVDDAINGGKFQLLPLIHFLSCQEGVKILTLLRNNHTEEFDKYFTPQLLNRKSVQSHVFLRSFTSFGINFMVTILNSKSEEQLKAFIDQICVPILIGKFEFLDNQPRVSAMHFLLDNGADGPKRTIGVNLLKILLINHSLLAKFITKEFLFVESVDSRPIRSLIDRLEYAGRQGMEVFEIIINRNAKLVEELQKEDLTRFPTIDKTLRDWMSKKSLIANIPSVMKVDAATGPYIRPT